MPLQPHRNVSLWVVAQGQHTPHFPEHRVSARDFFTWIGAALKALSGIPWVALVRRVAPAGALLPAHRHPMDEECIVLEGTLKVGTRIEVGPGGYHLAHQGALHAPVSTRTGATIFLRGAVPEADHALG